MINYKILFIIFNCLILIIQHFFFNFDFYKNLIYIYSRKWNIKIPNFFQIKTHKLVYADKIPVLTYHMVLSDYEKKLKKNYNDSISISKKSFIKQIKWIYKKGYKTLNCQELYLWHQKRIELPKKSLLITFDGGSIGQEKYAMPILKKFNMKGVIFIIGIDTFKNNIGKINYNSIYKLKNLYPNFEFQSHTYNLHKKFKKNIYNSTINDAFMQKKYFNFSFLAYPFGIYSPEMIKAYKNSGIKMAFTYGINDYATRKQNIYKIRRIKVNAKKSFSHFTKWLKD